MPSSPERQKWRRMPISALAYTIRMEGVRHANIHPTCRLDKSNRALYEPEDVWAKRAALAKIDSRSGFTGKTKGLLKQRVITMSTTRVTKEDMEAVDRVKQTVAVLMKNKERAADIGSTERRILQPRVARDMNRMDPERRAEFEGRVQTAIERMVYAAKRRYIRRQEKLDEVGIFHPEANAQRVHTQFWADLQSKVNVTKIENAVWAKMSAEMKEARTHAKNIPGKLPVRLTAAVADEPEEAKPGLKPRNSSNRPRRSYAPREEQEQRSQDDGGSNSDTLHTVADDSSLLAPSSDKFVGIPGYDEVGHVPTLEEFRQEWPRVNSRPIKSQQLEPTGGGSSKGIRRGIVQGQGQGQPTAGGVVQSLSKKDEVFRHFKKYYDKAEHNGGVAGTASGGVLGLSLSAAGSATGILQPDFSIVEAIGQHNAEVEEMRRQSKVGEGIMSTTAGSRRQTRGGSGGGRRSRTLGLRESSGGGGESGGNVDGLANVFEMSVEASEDSKRRAVTSAVSAFSCKGIADETVATSNLSGPGTGGERNSGDGNGGGRSGRSRGSRSSSNKESLDTRPTTKGSLEGSSTAAELKTTLEAAWRALQVPARLKLDFLQKYSTLERALDLPRAVQLIEIAAKAIPLREKVMDLLHRMETHGEPISATSAFSTAEEDGLYDLDCWIEFADATRDTAHGQEKPPNDGQNRDVHTAEHGEKGAEGNVEGEKHLVEEESARFYGVGGDGVEHKESRPDGDAGSERERRRKGAAPAAPVVAWLTIIKFKLTEKCAETCDLAWYEVGETLTYQGRSVAAGLPPAVVDAAALRREDRENINVRKRRVG